MYKILMKCVAAGLPLFAGCISIDRMPTGSVSAYETGRSNRSCYQQESLTQPRFGSCPGYHEAR